MKGIRRALSACCFVLAGLCTTTAVQAATGSTTAGTAPVARPVAALPAALAPAPRPSHHVAPHVVRARALKPRSNRPHRATQRRSSLRRIDRSREAQAIRKVRYMRRAGQKVWCVPFARNVSGMDIHGDARTWWGQAAGSYDRSHQPEVGAVMNFRPTSGMPLGHVAVVSKVISAREILVDHANWHRDRVSIGMAVIDVSRNNDWSKVRVESRPDTFGQVYPVYGFISAPGNAG